VGPWWFLLSEMNEVTVESAQNKDDYEQRYGTKKQVSATRKNRSMFRLSGTSKCLL